MVLRSEDGDSAGQQARKFSLSETDLEIRFRQLNERQELRKKLKRLNKNDDAKFGPLGSVVLALLEGGQKEGVARYGENSHFEQRFHIAVSRRQGPTLLSRAKESDSKTKGLRLVLRTASSDICYLTNLRQKLKLIVNSH